MSDEIAFCVGPTDGAWCGRYATIERARMSSGRESWYAIPPADPYAFGARTTWRCPSCFRIATVSRVRSSLVNGVQLGTRELSATEREAARQVLGDEFLAAVDKGWDVRRGETPPYGVPMGMTLGLVGEGA